MQNTLPLRQVEQDQKAVFSVPFERDLRFVGREDVLQKIDAKFKTSRRVALCGIGGIG